MKKTLLPLLALAVASVPAFAGNSSHVQRPSAFEAEGNADAVNPNAGRTYTQYNGAGEAWGQLFSAPDNQSSKVGLYLKHARFDYIFGNGQSLGTQPQGQCWLASGTIVITSYDNDDYSNSIGQITLNLAGTNCSTSGSNGNNGPDSVENFVYQVVPNSAYGCWQQIGSTLHGTGNLTSTYYGADNSLQIHIDGDLVQGSGQVPTSPYN